MMVASNIGIASSIKFGKKNPMYGKYFWKLCGGILDYRIEHPPSKD